MIFFPGFPSPRVSPRLEGRKGSQLTIGHCIIMFNTGIITRDITVRPEPREDRVLQQL